MKKLIIILTLILIFSSCVNARFVFQDNTYKSVLRCCNTSGQCELLYGSEIENRTSEITNICYCYEVQDDKLQMDVYSDIVINSKFYIVVAILLGVVVVILVTYKRNIKK